MQTTSASLFISLALVVFGISYYYFTTRHKERMTIMEKGLPPDHFKGKGNYLPFLLTLGIVSIGIAVGVLAGVFLREFIRVETIYTLIFCVFFFLGLSLFFSYLLLKSMNKN